MATRMVLVPEELFERFKEKKILPAKSSDITKKLHPRDQAKLLIQQQLGFKRKKDARKARVLTIPIKDEDTTSRREFSDEETTSRQEFSKKDTIEHVIRDIIPSAYYRRTMLLLRHLNHFPHKFYYDKDGNMWLNERQQDVNLLDLMKAVGSPMRKFPNVAILDEFAQILVETQTPSAFLVNKHLIEQMDKYELASELESSIGKETDTSKQEESAENWSEY